jgi:hypothetical protein
MGAELVVLASRITHTVGPAASAPTATQNAPVRMVARRCACLGTIWQASDT